MLICLLIGFSYATATAQKRHTRNSESKKTSPRVICKTASIPKGFVIVGYKPNSSCSDSLELVVRRPADTEIVCAESPVPDGYQLLSQQASDACALKNSNPLTNAVMIVRDGTAVPQPTRIQESADENEQPKRISANRQTDQSTQANPEDKSAPKRPSRENIDIAIRKQTVLIGMEMQDVSRAWGSAHATDLFVEDRVRGFIWTYRRGKVYFNDGVVFRVTLLKG
jgi:hypothetical protein